MEQSIVPNSRFTKAMARLIRDFPEISTRSMGFPSNWEKEPLWTI